MPINLKNYHPKWSLICYLVKVVRAKNRCEGCGAEHEKMHPLYGKKVIITTSHLNQDRTINRFWNLAALCQWCHLAHDRKANWIRRKYGKETQYLNGKLFEVEAVGAIPKEPGKQKSLETIPPALLNGKLFEVEAIPTDPGNDKAPVKTEAIFSTLNP